MALMKDTVKLPKGVEDGRAQRNAILWQLRYMREIAAIIS